MSENDNEQTSAASTDPLHQAIDRIEKGVKAVTRNVAPSVMQAEIAAVLGLSRLYQVDVNGRASAESTGFDIEGLRSPAAVAPFDEGVAVTINLGNGQSLSLDSGAGVVLGKPDSGKSLLANTMRQQNADLVSVIRFREPEADSLLSERAFVERLYEALYKSEARVVFVDSLRTTFYTTSGPTGKGGVNMAIFSLLTAYDILARRCGKVLLFALNPMSTDDVAIDYYLEASRGSVSHTISATSPKLFKISSRSNKTRSWHDGKYQPDDQPAKVGFKPLRASNHMAVATTHADEYSIVDLYVVQH